MPEPLVRIPYVIDNINNRLVNVLNALLQRQKGQDVGVATAYFSIRGSTSRSRRKINGC